MDKSLNPVKELTETNDKSTASEIKSALQLFSSAKISTVKRKQNCLAHELAARARRHGDLLTTANVPEELRSLMLSESTPTGTHSKT